MESTLSEILAQLERPLGAIRARALLVAAGIRPRRLPGYRYSYVWPLAEALAVLAARKKVGRPKKMSIND